MGLARSGGALQHRLMTEHIELPCGTVQYERAGEGPVVVLVHALGPRAWGWPLTRLARDCTVLAMGRFTASAACPSDVSEMDLVLPVLQREHCQRFTLCCWSMAGVSVLRYAAKQPPELDRLILVDVAGLGGPRTERSPEELAPPRSAAEWARRCAERWVHQPGPARDLVEALGLEHLLSTPGAFEATVESNRQIREAPPPLELEKVNAPTLVLAGRHSRVMGPELAQAVARRLSQGRVVIFEQSAHALALEQAVHFQNVVAEFMLEQPAR